MDDYTADASKQGEKQEGILSLKSNGNYSGVAKSKRFSQQKGKYQMLSNNLKWTIIA